MESQTSSRSRSYQSDANGGLIPQGDGPKVRWSSRFDGPSIVISVLPDRPSFLLETEKHGGHDGHGDDSISPKAFQMKSSLHVRNGKKIMP
jgi:hypothetical protein